MKHKVVRIGKDGKNQEVWEDDGKVQTKGVTEKDIVLKTAKPFFNRVVRT